MAALSCSPVLYQVVPLAAQGIASGCMDSADVVSKLATNIIEGDPLTLANFAYLGLTAAFVINKVTSKKAEEKKEGEDSCGVLIKPVLWFMGWTMINVVILDKFKDLYPSTLRAE